MSDTRLAKSRPELAAGRLAFDRFRARESFLDLLRERTNAFAILRRLCEKEGAHLVTGLDWRSTISLQVKRQWVVGDEWAAACNLGADWIAAWVFPIIPYRWITPWVPLQHEEMLQGGKLLLYQLPPWVPSAIYDAWWFDPGLLETLRSANYSDDGRVYVKVQYSEHRVYFADRKACSGELLEETHDSILSNWEGIGELPPNPLKETRGVFLERMIRAWQRRHDFLSTQGLDTQPSVRKPDLHAEWFLQFQVLRKSYEEVWAQYENVVDLSTIKKGIGSFAKLIDVPLQRGCASKNSE